jgi:hypothetical protein
VLVTESSFSPATRAAHRVALLSARPSGTIVLWLVLVGAYLLTSGFGSMSSDVTGTYGPAWTLAQHGTADVDRIGDLSIWFREVDGHLRSDRFAGAILIGVPAYWLLGDPDLITVFPSVLTACFLAAGTVAFMHRSLLRAVGPGWALAGALVLALGTSTWAISADGMWTHTLTQFGLSMTLYGLASRRIWFCGLGMVLAASARPHTAAAAAVLGIGNLLRTHKIWTALVLALGSLGGFAVVLVWSGLTLDHASLFPGTYTGRGNAASTAGSRESWGWANNVAGYLVSPERGVLVMLPFLIPCLFGAARAWRTFPGWVRDAAIASAVYSVVQLSVNNFAGGWGFYSFRLGIEAMTLVTPLAVLGAREIVRSPRWAPVTVVLVAYSLTVHALGSIWYENLNEGPKWWTLYQPWQMTQDNPRHAVVAVLIGLVLTAVVVALAASDRHQPVAAPDEVEDQRGAGELSAEPAAR